LKKCFQINKAVVVDGDLKSCVKNKTSTLLSFFRHKLSQ
jgi:hypothetical protein